MLRDSFIHSVGKLLAGGNGLKEKSLSEEDYVIILGDVGVCWYGGKVQFIGNKIIHLMRGYDICRKKFRALDRFETIKLGGALC